MGYALPLENDQDKHCTANLCNSEILWFSGTEQMVLLINLRDSIFNISLVWNGTNLIVMYYQKNALQSNCFVKLWRELEGLTDIRYFPSRFIWQKQWFIWCLCLIWESSAILWSIIFQLLEKRKQNVYLVWKWLPNVLNLLEIFMLTQILLLMPA